MSLLLYSSRVTVAGFVFKSGPHQVLHSQISPAITTYDDMSLCLCMCDTLGHVCACAILYRVRCTVGGLDAVYIKNQSGGLHDSVFTSES